jgi:cytochrome P450 family 135
MRKSPAPPALSQRRPGEPAILEERDMASTGPAGDITGEIAGSAGARRTRSATGGRSRLPAGPPLPTFVQAAIWALRPLDLMDRCAVRYGEVFTLRVRRGSPWVLISNPEHVKLLFTNQSAQIRAGAGEANPLLEPLLGSRSVMLLDEPQHLGDRKRLLPSFHGDRMRDYGAMMTGVAERQIRTWPIGEPFELWPRMQAISLDVVMSAVFDELEPPRRELLRERLVTLTDWINQPRRLALLAAIGKRSITNSSRFHHVMGEVEAVVLDEVRRRRTAGARPGRDDIHSMLEREYGGEESHTSEKKMRDELVTMLSDGPTATSLAWVFERLLRHPDKLARLREEVLGGESEEYLDAVVKETLRLCPAVPLVMRRLAEPMQLGEHTIPPGTIVAPSVYLMHRRADVYPQPLEFRPERFLESSAGTYTWIPFGGGVRRCVAWFFAQLEMKRVIQVVLREFDLSPAASGGESAMRSSVSFAPDGGARVIATRRHARASGETVAA